jgi:predicted DNA-binding transcriptional regulator YafY
VRADRLLKILLLLQNEGKRTTAELADRLEVSQRTVMRDMEALSMAGVPVYAARGRDGGWLLPESYRTNLTGLKSEEFLSLIISAHPKLLADLGFKTHFDAAFQKLLASSPAVIRQSAEIVWKKIHIDGAGWHPANEAYPCLPTVREAVWTERKLSFIYRRDDGDAERTVHPLGLVAKRSVWYLVAEIEGSVRTYRISRIKEARLLDETFVRPPDFDLAKYWEQSTAEFRQNLPRYPARLNIRAAVLDRLQKERYVQVRQTEPAEDGWIAAEVEFETADSACEIVLSFGPAVRVLAPLELREKVIAAAQAVVNLYVNRN